MNNFSISKTFITLTGAKSDGLSLNNRRACFMSDLVAVINFIHFYKKKNSTGFLNRLLEFMIDFISLNNRMTLFLLKFHFISL